MKDVIEEFKDVIWSPDYFDQRKERITQLYLEKGHLLNEDDKEKILFLIADNGCSADGAYLLAFCEAAGISFSVEQAKEYTSIISGHSKHFNSNESIQKDWSDFIFKMAGHINGDITEYFVYMVEIAIAHDWICLLQNLLKMDKDQHFITSELKRYEDLLAEQPDMRISEMVKRYFETGDTGDDWSVYLDDGYYEADTYDNRAAREAEERLNYQIPGIKNHRGCILERIDDSHYKYSRSPAYVNIIRNEDGTWYYTRLENISRSNDFDTLQECIEVAYRDMIASKL